MLKEHKNRDFAKKLRQVMREVELEQNEGKPRSKIWDERPSPRQERKKVKEKLRFFDPSDDYLELD